VFFLIDGWSAAGLGIADVGCPPLIRDPGRKTMIILGIILLLLGFFLHISILWTIGIILLVIGVVLFLLGSFGRPVAGRRHYW
jgi:hypothetical protein